MTLYNKKVLLVAGNIDKESISFEHVHFYINLKKIVSDIKKFDFRKKESEHGNEKMQTKLIEYVSQFKPDFTIVFIQEHEFLPSTIIQLNQHTKTIAYLYDDPWRMNYSTFWSKYYNYITTSDINGVRKFNNLGVFNVIYSPFFSDTSIYRKLYCNKEYDVSFFGGYHPVREWFYKELKNVGIKVNMFGPGWKNNEMLETEELVNIINKSKIILNLSNSLSWDIRQLLLTRYKKFPLNNIRLIRENIKHYSGVKDRKDLEMIKMRTFEISACGTAQISFYSEGLELFFDIGKEIIIYTSLNDLIEKVKYFLNNDGELEKISNNSYNRFLKDHTAELRLRKLIDELIILN